MLEDEQILSRAVVTAEEDGVELLPSSGSVAVMVGWRHVCRLVLVFNALRKVSQDVLRPAGTSGLVD